MKLNILKYIHDMYLFSYFYWMNISYSEFECFLCIWLSACTRIFKINFFKNSFLNKKIQFLVFDLFCMQNHFRSGLCPFQDIYFILWIVELVRFVEQYIRVSRCEWNTKRAQLIIIGNTFTSRFKPFKLLLWRLWFASFVSKLVDIEITSYLLDILYVISRNFEIMFLWFINRSRN